MQQVYIFTSYGQFVKTPEHLMTDSIYHFDRLKSFDKWTIGLYLLLTVGLSFILVNEINVDTKATTIFIYALGTQLILYTFCYKSLRNLTVFVIWTLFGILHLFFYFKLKDDVTLQMFTGYSIIPLRNTIPLLIFYQLLRLVSIKIQGQELVVPNKISRMDMFKERQPTWVDFLLLLSFWTTAILLTHFG